MRAQGMAVTRKALSPMLSKLEGKLTDVSAVCEKALLPILSKLEGKLTDVSDEQEVNTP